MKTGLAAAAAIAVSAVGPAIGAPISGCLPPVAIARARIASVNDRGVLVLADRRRVWSEGLLLPLGSGDGAPGDIGRQALAALRELAVGRQAKLLARKPTEDRYGRLRAQVLLSDAGKTIWLQAAMLRRGYARAAIAPDRPECAREFYAVEYRAREAQAGLWSAAAYAVRAPRSLRNRDLGTFQIVEGKVVNAAVRGSRAYLNFGRNWRTDFTVTVSPADMKRFEAAGIDPYEYAGKTVRVRGWIERMNGFEIEAASAAAIEIIEPRRPSPQ